MTDQDYLQLFDSADELAAVEAIADELKEAHFSAEDSLLDEISSIEQSLETENLAADFDPSEKHTNDHNKFQDLRTTLDKLKHHQLIQQQQFNKLRQVAAPHWRPSSSLKA